MKNTIILFDLDGTLIDSTEAILESFAVTFETFDEPIPEAASITALIGEPLDSMFVLLGTPPEKIDGHVTAYKTHYRRISRAKTRLLPGVRKAVEQAAAFAYLGIVTTKTTSIAIQLMEHLELMPYFNVLIGRNDVTHPKPHPEPIRKALLALPGVTGARYMVGDTCMDMEAAQASDIVGMGVLCGYGNRALLTRCTKNIFQNVPDAVTRIING